MGKPAARITDIHTCPYEGGPISGPGAPTVLIGGAIAAVMGDLCTCKGPTGNIFLGSKTVFIAGRPAARLGDPITHGGTIIVDGKITGGISTVLIGD